MGMGQNPQTYPLRSPVLTGFILVLEGSVHMINQTAEENCSIKSKQTFSRKQTYLYLAELGCQF